MLIKIHFEQITGGARFFLHQSLYRKMKYFARGLPTSDRKSMIFFHSRHKIPAKRNQREAMAILGQ